MAFNLGSLLNQYIGGANTTDAATVANDFHNAAQAAPPEVVGSGVAEALRSDQTPPFSQMIGQLFGNADPQQKTGMLNQLISGLNPAMLSSIGGLSGLGGLGGGLGGILGSLMGGGGSAPSLTNEQASQLTPEQVQAIAAHAEKNDPGIFDKMGNFYAAHPTLVKTLGTAALAIAMRKMAQRSV